MAPPAGGKDEAGAAPSKASPSKAAGTPAMAPPPLFARVERVHSSSGGGGVDNGGVEVKFLRVMPGQTNPYLLVADDASGRATARVPAARLRERFVLLETEGYMDHMCYRFKDPNVYFTSAPMGAGQQGEGQRRR